MTDKSQPDSLSVQNADDEGHFPLSSKEWALLTYIVRTYDVDTAIQIGEKTNSTKPKRKTLDLNFFQEHNKRSKSCLNFIYPTQSLLSDKQRTLLSNIISTYDKHSAIPTVQHILSKQSSYQPKLRFKLKHTLNIINTFFLSLNFFLNELLPHTMIDQTCQEYIQKTNFSYIACLNGLFVGRETYLLHNQAHAANFNLLYTKDLMSITNRLIYQLDQNEIIFKLFIVILSFSTHLSIVSYDENFQEIKDEYYKQLNQYQNIFVDLLWKYMLYKYDYHECIHRFSALVKIVLDLLNQLYQTEKLFKTRQLL